MQESVTKVLEGLQSDQKTEAELILPENIGEMSLTWYDREKTIWPKVFVFGNICLILVYFVRRRDGCSNLKTEKTGLRQDYPEIVYRFVLLMVQE